MDVKIHIGAHAYACITESGRKTDILLAPGKSAQASLREYAQEQRERAARIIAMADIAERAAAKLDPAPSYIQAGERLVVTATIQGIGPILCARPYPRPDHCDPFTYTDREGAEAFAATMRQRCPGNIYQVEQR